MSSIRAVLFDVGGVLTSPIAEAMTESARLAAVDLDSIGPKLWEIFVDENGADNPAHALERGEITFDEFVEAAGPIGRDIWAIMHPASPHCMYHLISRDESMHRFVDEVKTAGYATGIVSNVMNEWLELWDAYTRPIDRFDSVIYSCVDAVRKPSTDIFELALSRMGLAPHEALYLDDGPVMVATAQRLGMTAVLVDNHDEAIVEARRLLAS